ncbi:MAG: alpha/beta hydrolase [Actinomycetia bacterium]|nr:alpha/beta hydrolase [Actinomycetes bacterium]
MPAASISTSPETPLQTLPETSPEAPKDVVLVHGLWHRPSHLEALRVVLTDLGYDVRVPELHRGSLAADVAAVQQVVDSCAAPPLLLGHSYGGAVIGQISGAAGMLFVAAFVLEAGESCSGHSSPPSAAPAIDFLEDGRSLIRPELAREYFYADCRPEDADAAIADLRPQAPGHGRATASRVTWRDVPTRYVVCSEDRALHPDIQRRLAARCDSSAEIAASHSPFLSEPERIAAEVVQFANQV